MQNIKITLHRSGYCPKDSITQSDTSNNVTKSIDNKEGKLSVNNNNTENYKHNTLQESDTDEHGKGVLLFLVGIMVLLSFLMINAYQLPNDTQRVNVDPKNDTTQPSSEIVNTSEKSESKNLKVITSNVRMI